VRNDLSEEFLFTPGLIQLNHASFGHCSRRVAEHAARLRAEIEADPNYRLGPELTERLRAANAHVATTLALPPDTTTLCSNATSAAAALITSLPLGATDTVVVLDCEYSSIIRAWETVCDRVGARLVTVPVVLPFEGAETLLSVLDDAVTGTVTYLQASLITSSAAIELPVSDLCDWVHRRGGHLVLDAAHAPGHTPLPADLGGAVAVFGTLHKWIPAPRAVGFLSVAPDLVSRVRPAEVSLTWDSEDLVERFSWPGTFDPVPRLALPAALDQWRAWQAEGLLEEAVTLSDSATELLAATGARPTATSAALPPRLRAFILDGVGTAELKSALHEPGIRAWVGPGPRGECLLRVALHIYNDLEDLHTLAGRVEKALSSRR
jgi:selenocysteine lyase/cysteine desulfurase